VHETQRSTDFGSRTPASQPRAAAGKWLMWLRIASANISSTSLVTMASRPEPSASDRRSGDETPDPLSALLGYRRVHDVWQGLEQWVDGAYVAA
jgi:hypothetical protein